MVRTTIPAQTLGTRGDPCPFNYIRGRYSVESLIPPAEQPKLGFVQRMKRTFERFNPRVSKTPKVEKTKTKTKSVGFATPQERNPPQSQQSEQSQPSLRSRPSKAKTAEQHKRKPVGAPSSFKPPKVTEPYIRSRNSLQVDSSTKTSHSPVAIRDRSSLQVHSYTGASQPDVRPENTVRFSHPAVVGVHVRPRTPSAASQMLLDVPSDTVSLNGSIPPSEAESPNASAVSLADVNTLRPKMLWRQSGHFKTADGNLTSFSEFKARLDGHPTSETAPEPPSPLPFKVSERPPTLGFIPTVGSFCVDDEPAFQTKAAKEAARIQKNRHTTLNILESRAAAFPSTQHPATLLPAQYPSALLPGGPAQRPFSYPPAQPSQRGYIPYRPGANIASAFSTNEDKAYDARRPKTPDFLTNPEVSRTHYNLIESSDLDSTARASIQQSESFNDLLTSKQLPPNPSPESKPKRDSNPAAPYKMNSNRYPIIDPAVAKRFSTEAKYQRRSVNDVEAKFIKEMKAKRGSKAVEPANSAKAEPAPASVTRPVSSYTMNHIILAELETESQKLAEKRAHVNAQCKVRKAKVEEETRLRRWGRA